MIRCVGQTHTPATTKPDYFCQLSDEIVLNIFKFIPKSVLLKCSLVCRRWYSLAHDETLWRKINFSNRILHAEILIKFLNKGVKIIGLGRAEIRQSFKKRIVKIGKQCLDTLPAQLDHHIHSNLLVEYLDLTNAIIDTESLNIILKNCRNIKKLSLESLHVNTDTFDFICQNGNLNTLNLSLCKGINVDCIVILVNGLTRLRCLNISWTHLDQQCVRILCSNLPVCLEKLNLSGCRTTLSDNDVENLVRYRRNLVELDLSDARNLTTIAVEYIVSNLQDLQYLALSRCYSILPKSYLMLSKLNHLTALDIFNIVNDKQKKILLSRIPSLKYINKYPFSSIARPIVAFYRTSIWGCRIK